MINHYQNVKITEGNEFSLLVPIKTRCYNENGSFIDEVIDARTLTECVVTFGNVEYKPQLSKEGVLINLPANLARATYSVIVTAKHNGVAIRAALFQAVTIVAWSYQSNAEQFLPNSPIVLDAAFVIRPIIGQRDIALETTYAYLRSRLSGNKNLGIPAKMPIVENGEVLAEDIVNLNKYLHLNDGFRIYTGVDDSIPIGLSLLQLFGDANAGSKVTKLYDYSNGWINNVTGWLASVIKFIPNCREMHLNITDYTTNIIGDNVFAENDITIWLDKLKEMPNLSGGSGVLIGGNNNSGFINGAIHLPALEFVYVTLEGRAKLNASKLYFDALKNGVYQHGGSSGYTNKLLKYIYLGCWGEKNDTIRFVINNGKAIDNIVTDVELRNGACQNITLINFGGLTEENIYSHILQKLKQDEPLCGEGVTITLGATNLAKLTSETSIALLDELTNIYGYTFA